MQLDPSAFAADPELLAALSDRSTRTPSDEDQVLFRQGELPRGLFVLFAGSAILTMTSLEGETVVRISVSAGSLLGLPAFIGNQPYSLTAEVLKGAELGFVKREDFSEMMLKIPALSLKVLSVLAAEVRAARSALSES
ncbi:MAG: cyclic nucleotide-binding domain-containing protein [Terracidiphilus sp.]